ncbi:MAG: glycosyltransferase family 2 protein [Chitinophagaceae bacterium]|nr:MAG: glycosyltransferase family 2 protein [Chitinophagaceae bacterium]
MQNFLLFMQEIAGKVSVVIPAFNAAGFLPETIASVVDQTYSNREIIIVDDGSTDNTKDLLREKYGQTLTVISQQNAGVSAARNTGLEHSSGEYIIFLDADDLLTPAFIEIRVKYLAANPDLAFAGNWIETFPKISEPLKAVAEDPEQQILFFAQGVSTVPSNYMFRKKVLEKNGLRFNTRLSSTADRFFLLEVSRYAKGLFIDDTKGRLKYRINDQSMSHLITPGLIFDNEVFYRELQDKNLVPQKRTRNFRSRYFFSLAGGFMKIKYLGHAAKYFLLSFIQDPSYLMARIFDKVRKYAKRQKMDQ